MSCYTLVFYLHPDILPHFILYSSLSVPHSGPFLSDIPSSSYGAFVFLPSQILVLFVEIAWHFHFALVHLILVPSHAFPFMSFYPLALVGSNGLVLCSYALFLALLLSSLASLCSSHCAFLSSVVIQILWPSLDFGSWPVWCAYFIGRCSHCVAWSVLFPLLYPLPWGWGYLLQSFTGAWGHLWFYHSILMVYLPFSFSLSFGVKISFFLYGFFSAVLYLGSSLPCNHIIMGPPYGPSCILACAGLMCVYVLGGFCLPCIHVSLYISLSKWELSHIMTIEHYVLWGVVRHGQQMPARSSYSSGLFPVCIHM